MEDIQVTAKGAGADAVLHHMPCKIALDGPAKVSSYFVVETGETGAPVSHFRGRKLDGLVLELPIGVTGAVMREVPVDTPAKTAVNAGNAGRRALNNYRPGAGPSSNYGIDDEEEEDMGFGAGGYGGSDDDDDDLRDMLARRRGSGTNADVPTPSDAASARPKRAWVVDATFSRITEWQHDRPVTDNDLVPAALEWIELARVLHS